MAKYRKKPVDVDAVRLDVDGITEDAWWFWEAVTNGWITAHSFGRNEPGAAWCEIRTLEGTMAARAGDYIIRGVHGEIYPCKADIFRETYEPVLSMGREG